MDENNYGKSIPIALQLDTSDLEKKIDVLNDVLSSKTGFEKPEIDNKQTNKEDSEAIAKRKQIQDATKRFLKTVFKQIGDTFLDGLKTTFTDAWQELNNIINYSTMTDSSVRDLKLGYGFSSSQAYGFDKALSVTGIGSMEDLMWANSMQLQQFKKAFDKYTTYYETTMTPEYVERTIEFQTEMEMFKQDVQNEIIEFFMNNKDTIMKTFEVVIATSEFLIESLGWLVDHFNGDARNDNAILRDSANIISSYANSKTTNNVNTTNNFNAVSDSDKTWLTNAVSLAYKQQITVLNNS